MKENISKGIANTPDNLKTELSTGGMKLSWKELMNMQKTGEYIDKFLCETSPVVMMVMPRSGLQGHMCTNQDWGYWKIK